MMFDDEELPKNKKPQPKKLDGLSITELKDYIVALEEEIVRAKQTITQKEAAHKAAQGFFKTS